MSVAAIEPDFADAGLFFDAISQFIHGNKTGTDDIGQDQGHGMSIGILQHECSQEQRIVHSDIWPVSMNLDADRRRDISFRRPRIDPRFWFIFGERAGGG